MDTPPIALIIFRRPDLTRQVFERIRAARPSRLFIIADGPRNPDERILCDQTRAIVTQVDWPCEMVTNFAPANLGLRQRLVSGITWVFEQAEEAIFLEDDCLPHPTFFRFCAELLERYRNEPRVMHISGNFQLERTASAESYYFTRFAHVWGWATWRRAWQFYDANLDHWMVPAERARFLKQLPSKAERRFWTSTLDGVRTGIIDTWDYQWTFSVLLNQGICINPTRNLVRNIGFGIDASHTVNELDPLVRLDTDEMLFPLVAPTQMNLNVKADRQVACLRFSLKPSWRGWTVRAATSIIGKANYTRLRQLFR